MKNDKSVENGAKIIVESPDDKTQLAQESLSKNQEIPAKELKSPKSLKKPSRWLLIIVGALSLIIGSIVGWRWWQNMLTYVTTDNAQIEGHISPISSRVSGTVEKVLVKDGDFVKAGQPLIILDRKDLQLAVEEAQANLRAAQAKLNMQTETVGLTRDTNTTQVQQAQANLLAKQASVNANQAQIEQAEALVNAAINKIHQSEAAVEANKAKVTKATTNVNKTEADWQRYEYLSTQGVVSNQQRDIALTAFKDAQAELLEAQAQLKQSVSEVESNRALLRQAQAQLKTAQETFQQAVAERKLSKGKVAEIQVARQQVDIEQAQRKSQEAQVAQAQAALDLAQQQLDYTVIKSPVTGYVGLGMGQLTVQVGQLVQPQQPLLSVVPLQSEQLYIEANVKETALEKLRIGETAEIEADAYPGQVFSAVVTGISPATGSEFALIPPDNATGNFNKVVQWVPVRLDLQPGTDPQHKLRVGLSVKVKISTVSQ